MRQTEVGLGRLVGAFIVILDLSEAGTRVDGRALGEVVLVLGTEGVALGVTVTIIEFDGEVREVGRNRQVAACNRDDRALTPLAGSPSISAARSSEMAVS